LVATNQERFYIGNNTFTSDLTQLGFSSDPATTDTGYYRIEITAADASNFSATATYLHGGNEASKCLTFSIDGRGTRTSAPKTDCWTRTR
jgi:type IV pilus assembly protein PilE